MIHTFTCNWRGPSRDHCRVWSHTSIWKGPQGVQSDDRTHTESNIKSPLIEPIYEKVMQQLPSTCLWGPQGAPTTFALQSRGLETNLFSYPTHLPHTVHLDNQQMQEVNVVYVLKTSLDLWLSSMLLTKCYRQAPRAGRVIVSLKPFRPQQSLATHINWHKKKPRSGTCTVGPSICPGTQCRKD